jgi:hypothetical protein
MGLMFVCLFLWLFVCVHRLVVIWQSKQQQKKSLLGRAALATERRQHEPVRVLDQELVDLVLVRVADEKLFPFRDGLLAGFLHLLRDFAVHLVKLLGGACHQRLCRDDSLVQKQWVEDDHATCVLLGIEVLHGHISFCDRNLCCTPQKRLHRCRWHQGFDLEVDLWLLICLFVCLFVWLVVCFFVCFFAFL